ncbi:MAG TPA: phage holin family protein [Candidatus Sulfotelmatobacter sp.]|jgi:putative membrane protein|nr:phage holin family protein [Candidatus Sulfotelmatobacter sp.]
MEKLLNWFANSLIIMIAAYILPGVHVDNLWTALLVSLVLGILNIFIKPLLLVLTLPITVVTFGLFLFVINAFLVLLAGHIVSGFTVDGFWWALLFSLFISFVNLVISKM